METRDPEIIKRDIQIADLMASNCALQAEVQMTRMDLARERLESVKRFHDQHVATKAALERELAASKTSAEAPPAPAA
jgi:hypothetical protein